jgi:hypothetical protein
MPSESLKSNTLSLFDIHWPVWPLRTHESISKGLITDSRGTRRLDLEDKSLPFTKRRLIAKELEDYKLYPLKKNIWTFKDLILSGSRDFIAYDGIIFKYKKSNYYPLIYREVIWRKYTSNSTIFGVKDVSSPFEVKGKLNLEAVYAGVLKVGRGYLLYEMTNTRLKDTRRMI